MSTRFLIPALVAAGLSAQSVDRTFYFTHDESPANLQTIADVVRGVGEISHAVADPAQRAVLVSGTADQIAVAGWLCHELSQPRNNLAPQEYRVANSDLPVIRVYFLANVATPADLQEATNAVRSVTDIQRAFPYALSSVIAIRGTADQAAAADFVLRELNQTGPAQDSQAYPLVGPRNEVAKIFYVKNTLTPQGLQELVNMTRSIADIQRFFPYNARTALVARGTPEQIALAGWLIQSFDRPVSEPVHEYRMPDTANTIVRFTYLANAQMPPNDLQGMVNVVRTETGIQRIYPSQYRKAVAMRGTADQISRADQLIRERDK